LRFDIVEQFTHESQVSPRVNLVGTAELAYIHSSYIFLDHDQTWTSSAGAAYTFNRDSEFSTRVSCDLLYQSGLRASTPTVPNGAELSGYVTSNMSIVQRFGGHVTARLDLLNLTDATYQIRNGTGVGVGAPQYGMRRTILAGLTVKF
jgi:outer membrane receptor protein involved in Fe transport